MRWLRFEYQGLELVILSKPFKTKKLAEKSAARNIGVGIRNDLVSFLHSMR